MQTKANEQCILVLLLVMLYKVILSYDSVDKTLTTVNKILKLSACFVTHD